MKVNDVTNLLAKGAYNVEFKKLDGTVRTMVCTTNPDLIAEGCGRDRAVPTINQKPNDDLVTVWDLQAGGIRSFHAQSVINVSPWE